MISLISIPALIFYIVIVPTYLVIRLKQQKQLIYEIQVKDVIPKAQLKKVLQLEQRWGFLIVGLKQEYYFWEFQVFARKTLFIFATEYLACVSTEV